MNTATESPVRQMFRDLRIQALRTVRAFAEAEIVLPALGPRPLQRFRVDYMPWTGLILDEFDAGRFTRFVGGGPTQTGKTLLFVVVPLLYHLFEMREAVIFGAPKIELAKAVWMDKVLPWFLRTRYRGLLPKSGAGSRGGVPDEIRFLNGATLRFMGAGGGDAQKSSHTARVVVLTETDKMDIAGQVSREAAPIYQIEARTSAYDAEARVYAECTFSIAAGWVNQEITHGSDTRIYIPCPHCDTWVLPGREHLVGWQEAADELAAGDGAGLVCPECGALWSEDDRRKALEEPRLVSRGQTTSRAGAVTGPRPRTHTFGVRWNAIHSAMRSLRGIAEEEWRVKHASSTQAEKRLLQFTWAMPWEGDVVDMHHLDRDAILRKTGKHPRGTAPEVAQRLTAFIDPGLYRCWWSVWAYAAEAQGFLVDYGAIEVPQGNKPQVEAILVSLRDFRDGVMAAGWKQGERTVRPALTLVDSAWEKEIAYQFCRESGPGFLPSRGQGSGPRQESWRPPRAGKDRFIAENWFVSIQQPGSVRLVLMNADWWKRTVHEGFAAAPGEPGSLELPAGAPMEHAGFARQVVAERQQEEFVPGKGTVVRWVPQEKDNHYLDCAAGARCAFEICRFVPATRRRPPAEESAPRERPIRARY